MQLLSELEQGHFPERRLLRGKAGPQSPALYPDDLLNYYGKETHIIPTQTKRGCPFSCAYCSYPMLEGRSVRERDSESVAQELESLSRRAPDAMFYFVDAVFNDPERKYHHLLNALRKRGLRIPFAAFLSPFHLTESDIGLLSDSGMIAAELGIDASTNETLRGLRKNFTFEEARTASELLRKHGIGVTTNVMFGGPGETMDTVRRGISNLRSLEPVHTLVFSGIRILPGTPLCEIARQEGKLPAAWNGSAELYYFADGLNPEQLHNTLTEGFRESRFCVYPPDAKNEELKLLHKFGYAKLRRLNIGGEPQTVADVAARARAVLPYVLIVDDGSTDRDLQALFRNTDITVLRHSRNLGKGAAILTALEYLKKLPGIDYMITLDADGQHEPEDIPLFFPLMERNDYSLIVGCRDLSGEHVPDSSKFGREFANFWMRVETGVRIDDCQSGFRAYPVKYVSRLHCLCRR